MDTAGFHMTVFTHYLALPSYLCAPALSGFCATHSKYQKRFPTFQTLCYPLLMLQARGSASKRDSFAGDLYEMLPLASSVIYRGMCSLGLGI